MKKILLSGMALTLLALACGEESVTDSTPANAPGGVLKGVQLSFNDRNMTTLARALNPAFVFYFDDGDVGTSPAGGSYIIPESWTYTEFARAAKKLFENTYAVDFRLTSANLGEPGPNVTTHRVDNVAIRFLVMVDELNGYLVNYGHFDFEFRRHYGEGGQESWRLTKWWDHTGYGYDPNPGLVPASFGRVLAMYYCQ